MEQDRSSILSKREIIFKAINDNHLIRFDYVKKTFDEAFSEITKISIRTILPFELITHKGNDYNYVRGYCFLREEERTFSIYKMENFLINPTSIHYCEYIEYSQCTSRIHSEDIVKLNFAGLIPPGKHVVFVDDVKITLRLDPEEPDFQFPTHYLEIIFKLIVRKQFIKVYLPLVEFKRIDEINSLDLLDLPSSVIGLKLSRYKSLSLKDKIQECFTGIPNKKGSLIAVLNYNLGKKQAGHRIFSKERTHLLLNSIYQNLLKCGLIQNGELDKGKSISFNNENLKVMVGRRVGIIVNMGGNPPHSSRIPYIEKIVHVNDV